MTNYTKATDFAAKDALITGNPAKVVKGVDINTEFVAIETAIASKSNTVDVVTLAAAAASSGSSLVGFIQSGTGAVATTVQTALRGIVNFSRYGGTGDGATNNTTPWANFIAQCVATGSIGEIDPGTYLMDPFSFTSAHAGLVLRGTSYGRTSVRPGVAAGAGIFGVPPTLLRCRIAGTSFISLSNCYDLDVEHVSLDGDGLVDNVLYFDGVGAANTPRVKWNDSFHMGAKATTGYTHRYAGTNGGESCTFERLVLIARFPNPTPIVVAAHVYNTNSNAFQGSYTNCTFSDATSLVIFSQGSSNLYDCEFFGAVTSCIRIETLCQPCVIRNAYTEQGTSAIFIEQLGLAGSHSTGALIIENPHNNSTTSPINLSCNQPVFIYGGRMSTNNITITPAATWGVFPVIADGVQFTTGAFLGTGASTHLFTRACGNLAAGVWTAIQDKSPSTNVAASWTPNQGSGLTVGGAFVSNGYSIKQGRLVTVTGNISATSISCTANGDICDNLPYAAGVSLNAVGSAVTVNANHSIYGTGSGTTIRANLAITASSFLSYQLSYMTA